MSFHSSCSPTIIITNLYTLPFSMVNITLPWHPQLPCLVPWLQQTFSKDAPSPIAIYNTGVISYTTHILDVGSMLHCCFCSCESFCLPPLKLTPPPPTSTYFLAAPPILQSLGTWILLFFLPDTIILIVINHLIPWPQS